MTKLRMVIAAIFIAPLMASLAVKSEAQEAAWQFEWQQVGGDWTSGWFPNRVPNCLNRDLRPPCSSFDKRGLFHDGARVLWWRDGCRNKPLTMKCVVKLAKLQPQKARPKHRLHWVGRWDFTTDNALDFKLESKLFVNSAFNVTYCNGNACTITDVKGNTAGDFSFSWKSGIYRFTRKDNGYVGSFKVLSSKKKVDATTFLMPNSRAH